MVSFKIIVGLGNPGPAYRGTRHNAGFLVLERLAKKKKAAFRLHRFFKSSIAEVKVGRTKVCLALPQTFMNRSGIAVAALLKKRRIKPADLLVVNDDLDLPLGLVRMRSRGGPGGHNGLASVIDCLGTREFSRLRVGIGRPEDPRADVVDYVLSRFESSQVELVREALERAVEIAEAWIQEGVGPCMNRYNVRGKVSSKELN